jgi:hypothetical protein
VPVVARGTHRVIVHDVGEAVPTKVIVRAFDLPRAQAAALARNLHAHGRWSVTVASLADAQRAEALLLERGLVVGVDEVLPSGDTRLVTRGRKKDGVYEPLDAAALKALRAARPLAPAAPRTNVPGLALLGAAVGVAVAIVVRRRPEE